MYRTAPLFLLMALAPAAVAQTFDFEDGLSGWTKDAVFDTQPVRAATVRSGRAGAITLGGDYWRDLPYPLGQHGSYLVDTAANNPGDTVTGTLTSLEFTLHKPDLCLSVLIGGTRDPTSERFELQVRAGAEFSTIFSTTGRTEALQQAVFQIPEEWAGHAARIRIVDASTAGHINVDYIRFTAAPPDAMETPVWGYADYHTHPMTYLAFGALQERPHYPIWGYPGGDYDDYEDNSLISCDIPPCTFRHKGGPMAELFLDQAQAVSSKLWSKWTLRGFLPHPHGGGPEFLDFPKFYRGAHQQMHITQIHRNYEGGLRLMVGLATDNLGAEYLTSHAEDGHVKTVRAWKSLEAQICGMLRMAELNQSWMEIAYTAEQARRIILSNKLAVVMGVEMDQLGELDTDKFPTPESEVEYLWQLGVRAVTPIHAINNRIGGPAVFVDAYNWDNDLVHRPDRDLTAGEVTQFEQHPDQHPPFFYDVVPDPSASPAQDVKGETVLFRLSATQARVALLRLPASGLRLTPFIWPVKWPAYATATGQRNKLGLLPEGFAYIRALMNKGMIVDTAHMSEASVDDLFKLIEKRQAECGGATAPGCGEYPAIISHAHFRAQAHYERDAPNEIQASEYDISDKNLRRVRDAGGVVGPFTAQSAIDSDNLHFANDCSMSSKSFGYAFHYGVQKIGGPGVGMATDFTFIPSVSPRFGPDACAGFKARPALKWERSHHKNHYLPREQSAGVVYDRLDQPGVRLGHNTPLAAYRMGEHVSNFNLEGLAHYGLIPDMLQDLKNVGFYREDFEALFSSAEGYLKMWEKAERLSKCNAAANFCNPVQPAPSCRLPAAPACRQ